MKWNLCITVGILGSLGQELDPVLDLCHTAVYAVTGALTPVAEHSNLGDSKYILYFINCVLSSDIDNIPAILRHHQRASRVSLAGVLLIVAVTGANVEAKKSENYISG